LLLWGESKNFAFGEKPEYFEKLKKKKVQKVFFGQDYIFAMGEDLGYQVI